MKKSEIMLAALAFVLAFFLGCYFTNKSIEVEEKVRYVKGETSVETVEVVVPYKVEIPTSPVYIYRADTVYNHLVQMVDSAAIIADWVEKRYYKQDLFDNENGKLSLEASVQYNRLQDMQYSFTPIEKQIISYYKPTYSFYVGTSYNTMGYMGIGGGFFRRNAGLGIQYTTDFNRKGLQLDLKYKF